MSETTHALKRETVAARRLVDHLRTFGDADDEEIVSTAVEGETNLYEAVSAALNEIDECEALELGLKAKEEEFANRRSRIERRKEILRAAIEAAMVEAEQRKIKLATRTIYLSTVAPKVVVENEAEIPSRFWTTPEPPAPKLDKKALKEALAAKEAIPGARLDNGSISLRMRS